LNAAEAMFKPLIEVADSLGGNSKFFFYSSSIKPLLAATIGEFFLFSVDP
jgi:hypothetical protein